MSRLRRPLGLVALSLLLSTTAHAARSTPPAVDPAIHTAFRYAAAHNDQLPPWYDARPNPERPAYMLPILLRPSAHARGLDLAALLQRAGVRADEAKPLHEAKPLASGVFSLWVSQSGLQKLASESLVERLSIDVPRRRLPPLDAARKETGVEVALRAWLSQQGTLLDGTGVTIADIDSGIYVQHPAFFRADAGAFAWIDVDGDGRFTLGTDGIDLDGDGSPEVVSLLSAYGASFYDPSAVVLDTDSALRPSLDFLYVDENNNGKRDSGPAFDESTPAYGEPLFVADDANGNGQLDPGERLLRLGTSKFRAIRTDRMRTRGASERSRGLNGWLDESMPDYTSHGVGVAGILGAGVWGVSRLLGLAPGAELLSYDYATRPSNTQTEAVQWAIDQGADVILTEYGLYTAQPLDGSSEEELLLDAATERGIIAVNPAGNLTGGGKHQSVLAKSTPQVVALDTDDYFSGSQFIALTILEPGGDHRLELTLTLADGSEVPVPDGYDEQVAPDGTYVVIDRLRTARGTTMRTLYAYRNDVMPLGNYALSVSAPAAPPDGVPLELYVSDGTSSWAYGVTFRDATEGKTVCHPATADRGLSVAAYTLHDEDGYFGSSPVGSIATYSSAGPRIDGSPGIGIAAPDNPLSPTLPVYGKATAANYSPFGGTSGAGPHVAAVAALLRQAYPDDTAAQIRARLVSTAIASGPEERWGAGKLDAEKALGVEVGQSAAPREARIELPKDGLRTGRTNLLRVVVDDDGDRFRTRWDLDYDGTPDTEWITGTEVELTVDTPGPRSIRVYLADEHGNVTGATLDTEVREPGAGDDGPKADAEDGGCGCRSTTTGSTGNALAPALAAVLLRRRRAR